MAKNNAHKFGANATTNNFVILKFEYGFGLW
jgi:hypothetical protein